MDFSERIFKQERELFKYSWPYSLAKRGVGFMQDKNLPVLK